MRRAVGYLAILPDLLSWFLTGSAAIAAFVRTEQGDMATGIVVAGLSLAFGLLNAATITPDQPFGPAAP